MAIIMLNILSRFFKLFGNKSDKDITEIMPLVEKIHTAYDTIKKCSNDNLRETTFSLKKQISDHLAPQEKSIKSLRKITVRF